MATTNLILKLSGRLFGVDLDADIQVIGGPLSFRLAPRNAISFGDIWDAIDEQVQDLAGFSLPDVKNGPWKQLFTATTVLPTLWISPSGASAGGQATGAYLELAFSEPVHVGGEIDIGGGLTISIEPNFSVYSLYFGYDESAGGLDFRAKISQVTTSTGGGGNLLGATSPAGVKTQIVTYPFPVPAQPADNAFKLHYIGLGQRVGPDVVVTGQDPIATIFRQLETQLIGNDPQTILTTLANRFYKPDRNWFIAADVELRGFRVRVIFNDPTMYGVEITVDPKSPTFFAGLLFEILYQKLGPNLGVYYGALTLPEKLRKIPLEGFYLILPGFSIWVYTNGDFRVNVGWPVGPNSAGIQVGPLVGAVGFYFARLRSADNPGAQPSVNFNPILAFGIGVSLFVQESFNASIFSASIAVSLTATFQGLLAWADGKEISDPPDHYWFAGTAGISVLIEGVVDFSIIKASVTISFTANAGIAFETGYATLIDVSAEVRVAVRVKIIFFTISLSFHTSISKTWTIGNGTPASVSGPLDPDLTFVTGGNQQVRQRALQAAGQLIDRWRVPSRFDALAPAMLQRPAALDFFSEPPAPALAEPLARLDAASRAAGAAPVQIDLQFVLQPTAVYGSPSAFNAIASLVMATTAPGSPGSPAASRTPFERLLVATVTWLLNMYPGGKISERFARIVAALGSGSDEPFGNWDLWASRLRAFLQSALTFSISEIHSDSPSSGNDNAAVMPVLDVLRLQYVDAHGEEQTIDFNSFDPTPIDYREAVNLYFEDVAWGGSAPRTQTRTFGAFASPEGGPSMASFVLLDYFLMLARNAANSLLTAAQQYEQEATARFLSRITGSFERNGDWGWESFDHVSSFAAEVTGDDELETLLAEFDYSSASGIGSRFLLNGLQLPIPALVPQPPTRENMETVPTDGLYNLTGQQFAVANGATIAAATLLVNPNADVPAGWITFGASPSSGSPDSVTSSVDLPAALPPMPAPPSDVLPLPPVTSHPLFVSLRDQMLWVSPVPRTILTLPTSLQALLAAQPLQMEVTATPPPGSPTGTSPASPTVPIDTLPALLIRLTLTQVPSNRSTQVVGGSPSSPAVGGASPSSPPAGTSPQYLPHIYEVGGTDEATRDLIFAALNGDLSQASISLLYTAATGSPLAPTGVASDDLSDSVLLTKTNLSTLNQIPGVVMAFADAALRFSQDETVIAPVTDVEGFLQLIWELSVVNASGFFLYYETADGGDLPASLFAQTGSSGGTAQFDVLVQLAPSSATVAVPQYANALVAGEPLRDAVFAGISDSSGTPLLRFFPTYPAGNVGFILEREHGEPSPGTLVPVDDLYQLIQYQVLGTNGYEPSVWSLPVGPGDSDDPDAPYKYLRNVPVYLFYSTTGPDGVPNRYSIIGNSVELALRVVDLYGDALPQQSEETFLPLYQDPIISVASWQGVFTNYRFLPGSPGTASLQIALTFDPEAAVPPPASPASPSSPTTSAAQQWSTVLANYALIVDQLSDPNLTATIATTLASGAIDAGTAGAELLSFATAVLESIVAGTVTSPASVDPVTRLLSFDVPLAAVEALDIDIFRVGVSIDLARAPRLVDPAAARNLPEATAVSYDIPADLTGDTSSPDVTGFARDFEQAFTGFDGGNGIIKLAERAGVTTGSTTPARDSFWAMRWSRTAGVSVTLGDDLVYYALAPLTTTPMSGSAAGRTFSNVDLDVWAREFLSQFDNFLSPQMAVAISLLDLAGGTSAYDDLIAAKRSLAETVPTGLTTLLQSQSGGGDATGARQRLTEQMLTTLGSAFTVTTVVQVPAQVTVAGNAESPGHPMPPQLYGAIVAPNAPGSPGTASYNLSPGELPLQSGSPSLPYMTSLLTVAQPGDQASLTLDLGYAVSYLQHDFQTDEQEFGYTPSSWLKFVLPDEPPLQMPIGEGVTIPVPLIFEPVTPTLQGQNGTGAELASPPVSPQGIAEEIAAALQWIYTVPIATQLAHQDELFFDVHYNGSLSALDFLRASAGSRQNLFNALAEYRVWYAEASPRFGEIIAAAFPSGSPGSPSAARELIDGFRDAARNVADAWAEMNFEAAFVTGTEEIIDSFRFELGTGSPNSVHLFGVSNTVVSGDTNPVYWPTIVTKDGQSWTPDRAEAVQQPDGTWELRHTFATAPDLSVMTLSFGPISMMDRQTAVLGAYVRRNANLLAGEATNADFVYTTETVTFGGPIVPLIERGTLSPLTPAATLTATIHEIITPLSSLEARLTTYLRVTIGYEFEITAPVTGPALMAASAVRLGDDIDLSTSPGGTETIAANIAREIADWFFANNPSTNGAVLTLGITLFGSVAGQELPIVQIAEIPIEVGDVAPQWWRS
ncbi:MAG TPA: hypothetical protein VE974_14330 [Thermoanaerobaculia bacterium]|nr:hypothetical protein [Thermoanaerobaculia bacterium]